MSEIKWYDSHDFYSIGGWGKIRDRVRCLKCGLKYNYQKGGWGVIKQTKCPIRTSTDLKDLLETHIWYDIPPKSYFHVEFNPYHIVEVKLEDLV